MKEGLRIREHHIKPMRGGLRDQGQRFAALDKSVGPGRGEIPRGGQHHGRNGPWVSDKTGRGNGLTGCPTPCTGVGVMESSDEVTGRESRKLESVYKNTDEPEEGMTVG